MINPSEIIAWSKLTGNIITPRIYSLIQYMDLCFCSEMNKELEAYRERMKERSERT